MFFNFGIKYIYKLFKVNLKVNIFKFKIYILLFKSKKRDLVTSINVY